MRRATALLLAASLALAGCSGEAGEPAGTEAPGTAPTTAGETTASTAVPITVAEEPPTTAAPSGPADQLAGLPFAEFADRSFEVLLLRSPQLVTELGIADRYGMRNDRLDDRSDAFLQETMAIEAALLDLLHGYDRDSLSERDRVTYDVYEWYLDDLVRGHPFAYHEYPLHHMLRSYHWDTFFYFTESFPLEDREDAEDFVAAVAGIADQARQVLDGLRLREEMGIYPPDFILEMSRGAMMGQLGMRSPDPATIDPKSVEIYVRFEEDTATLGLSSAVRNALLTDLEAALTSSLVPAWVDLIGYTGRLADGAGSDAGVWKLPDGDAYYGYLLRKETSTDLTPEQIHRVGLAEVARVQGELRQVFDALGYPADETLADSMGRIAYEGGLIDTRAGGPEAVLTAYEEYLARIEPLIEQAFGLRPEAPLAIEADRSFGGGGGFYSPASLDGTRPGAFYAGAAPGSVRRYSMPTILHHEGVPGHHFQIALAQELGLPLMRSVVNFNGYVEGWALYAERLAAELGAYEGDPYGDVGRLHLELLRAVRLVADTGIHAKGWSREEAQAYMAQAMGGWTHEVDRYIVLPAQATGYKVGMLEILRLRDLARAGLGDAFDLAAFHDVVIGSGSLPLEVLDRLVREWIDGSG